MSRAELVARDEFLLEQARHVAEAVIAKVVSPVLLPSWGRRYDPYKILGTTTDPGVFRLALVNIRTAIQPGEAWAKCVNCSRYYLVESYGSTCSPECFAAQCNFLDNPPQ